LGYKFDKILRASSERSSWGELSNLESDVIKHSAQFFVRLESAGCDAYNLFVILNVDCFKIIVFCIAYIQNTDSIFIEKLDSFESFVEFLGLEEAD